MNTNISTKILDRHAFMEFSDTRIRGWFPQVESAEMSSLVQMVLSRWPEAVPRESFDGSATRVDERAMTRAIVGLAVEGLFCLVVR